MSQTAATIRSNGRAVRVPPRAPIIYVVDTGHDIKTAFAFDVVRLPFRTTLWADRRSRA